MDEHAGVDVFRNGVGLEATDFHQWGAPEESRTPREEGAIVGIATRLKDPKEQSVFIFQFRFETEILLEDVRVVEVMRSLDDGDPLVLKESDRLAQEGGRRYMIGIEYSNQFPRSLLEGMVQIPSLGVIAPLPPHISAAHRMG